MMKNTAKTNQKTWRKKSARHGGSTLLEFAIVVPLLLLILIGIIEFGWMEKNQLTIANATREGARDASVGASTSAIRARIENRAASIPGAPSGLVISMMRDDGNDTNGYDYVVPLGDKAPNAQGVIYNDAPSASLIRIRVTIPHRSLTGFRIMAGRALTTDVIMRRE